MQLVGLLPWIVSGIALAALAQWIRTSIVGGVLLLAGLGVFAVRLHHAGPYPFPGAVDLSAALAALGAGALLIRSPWTRPSAARATLGARVLLGLSPVLLFAALGSRAWKHFGEREDLDEVAVALRFEPRPEPPPS